MPKEPSRRRSDRDALSRHINLTGRRMASCTRCAKSGHSDCYTPRDENLSRCGRCAKLGKSCDVRSVNRMPKASEWGALDAQIEKLDAEEEVAMSKILRLKKQKRFLYERKQKMIAAGLNSLDELEALEAKEREEQPLLEQGERGNAQRELCVVDSGPFDQSSAQVSDLAAPDSSFDLFSVFPPDDPIWAVQDVGGETPSVTQSN